MPVTKTAEKELRVAGRRSVRNRSIRTLDKSAVKKAEKLISAGDAAVKEAVATAASTLDKSAKRGVIHANKAARTKSRLMKKMNKAQGAAEGKAKEKK